MPRKPTKAEISRRLDMVALSERGWSTAQLAEHFGIDQSTVRRTLARTQAPTKED